MDVYSRHGGLVIDEIKLSEHLNVKSAGHIEGFVDLGNHTPADQKNVLADHGMVVLFQPFTDKLIYLSFLLLNHIARKACALRKYLYLYAGNWTQILGVFASKGNVKSATLAKIVVETTVLAEKAGLFVDCITCDGASWNRSMWRLFGIQGTPVDTVDANGNTALFVAITDGPVSAVPHLLQAGADPNFRCSGGATSVHAACRRGSRALLQQLLDCGGDLRLRDASGRTPQDWALGHADPLCRRKLVAFINNKRALAYRFGDADALLDEEAGGAAMLESGSPGGAAAAASLSRRLLAGRPAVPRRRSGCTEKIRAGGGFGVVRIQLASPT
ncbi:hypothetical protein HPB49_005056 [Dermacentor silvarum]|uniref:Uncharacterized protein n=1 Tax=Dermacentor silvarum TaxID=543639 RepID=A0ACB8CDF9_DERSI|nr:hypothetical protein HPB49_005056 [Dermacentor silvarum]